MLALTTTSSLPAELQPDQQPDQLPYTVRGTIDIGTLENSIFSWPAGGSLYLLENINAQYVDTAGKWFPEFAGLRVSRGSLCGTLTALHHPAAVAAAAVASRVWPRSNRLSACECGV